MGKKIINYLFLLAIILLVGIILVSSESGKVAFYDPEIQRVTIIDDSAGGDTIMTRTLTKNTYNCLINCYAEGEGYNYKEDYLIEGVKFKKEGVLFWKETDLNYKIFINQSTKLIEVDDYKNVCENSTIETNGTQTKNCWRNKTGSHFVEEIVWEEYDGKKIKGAFKWRIEGKKDAFETIDWIPTFSGFEIKEWALWLATYDNGLHSYYNFSSLNTTYSSGGVGNLTLTEGAVNFTTQGGCIKDNCYGFSGANVFNTSTSTFPSTQNFTINFWFNKTGGSSSNIFFTPAPEVINIEQLGLTFFVDSLATTRLTTADVNKGKWNMMTLTRNGTSGCIWLNGTLEACGINKTHGFNKLIYVGSCCAGNGVHDFIGYFDEMGVWSRSLSSAEISDLYTEKIFYDNRFPYINVVYPLNTSYTYNVTNFNYTYGGTSLVGCDSVWFSINKGLTNSTRVNCGVNFTKMNSTEGSNTWILWINDTAGIQNSTNITFFKDTINPWLNITSPLTTQTLTSRIVNITLNATDEAGLYCCYANVTTSAGILANPNHYINTTKGSQTQNFTISPDGNYIFHAFCNDTLGHSNYSSVSFTIDTSGDGDGNGGGSGGGSITIIEQIFEPFEAGKICIPLGVLLSERWEIFLENKNLETFKSLFKSFTEWWFCQGASSIIPI